MKVLLLGGSGQLGTEIRHHWPAAVSSPSHSDLDIADATSVATALESAEVVVNCAAFHNVDECERRADEAFRYNALAVDRIAEACATRGTTFLTVSTDYVFDGTTHEPYVETSCPAPLQVYGVSKLAGEYLALRRNPRTYVVRTCGLFGVRPSTSKGHTFIDRVISQLRRGERTTVVSDVVASPTYARHLAEALWQLLQTQSYGLYHAVNEGAVSWFDFASEAARGAGIDAEVEPISGAAWKAEARRPKYSALRNERLQSLGITLPDWRHGIADYLRDKAAADASA